MNSTPKLKQPKVFNLAFSTSLFERFGFYVLSYLLALYSEHVFGLSDVQAFVLFGVFNGLAYITPVIGGYIADAVFGIRRSIILGLFLEANGLLLLALSQKIFFFLGLGLIIAGVGFFKTAPTHLLARSYGKNDPRIDSGFTLFYLTMNIGGLFAATLSGFLQKYYGWHVAFFVAGAAIYLGLLCYFIFRKYAKSVDSKAGKIKLATRTRQWLLLGIILVVTISVITLMFTDIADGLILFATVVLITYYIYQIVQSDKEDRLKIAACLLLVLIGFVFNVLYFQAFTSVILFIERCLNRTVLGFTAPSTLFLMLDPLWIIILGPILAYLYKVLAKHKRDIHISSKFVIGLFSISICFLILKLSTVFPNADMKVNMIWIIAAFIIYALGELLVSALGVAVVTHIAPKRMYGVMMGTWYFVALALANIVSGMLAAGISAIPKTIHNPQLILSMYGRAFLEMGLIGLAFAVIAFITVPYIKRMV